jgi:formylglycine-generating enzyme required for sulfatase activity
MGWPMSQDYNEAVQAPASHFTDPDLVRGKAASNALGLPMPCSGNFADVYHLRCPGGDFAVKCFTRQVAGLRERYAAIGQHLRHAQIPFMVDFNYLAQGIRVQGQWYPVVKMQWVEGLLLNEVVRNSMDKPTVLDALLQIWVRMARRLRGAGIAHGDLQHGNIILVPEQDGSLAVKLIDYDGMYVPALAGKRSGEVGHPNYQHPQRLRDGTYGPEVDRFGLLVVAVALRCLQVGGRALWDRYDNGDNLLFKAADFASPHDSPLFAGLLKLPDPESRSVAARLMAAAQKPLEQTPLLEEVFPQKPAREKPVEQSPLWKPAFLGREQPAWWQGAPAPRAAYPAPPVRVPATHSEAPPPSSLATAVPDSFEPLPPSRYPPAHKRRCTASWAWQLAILVLLGLGFALGYLAIRDNSPAEQEQSGKDSSEVADSARLRGSATAPVPTDSKPDPIQTKPAPPTPAPPKSEPLPAAPSKPEPPKSDKGEPLETANPGDSSGFPSDEPLDGEVFMFVNANSGRCLTVKDGSRDAGANIVQGPFPASAGPAERWKAVRLQGFYKLVNQNSGKVLAVPQHSKEKGSNIIQWHDDEHLDQQWAFIKVGKHYSLRSRVSGLALAVSEGRKEENAAVIQWEVLNSSEQVWSVQLDGHRGGKDAATTLTLDLGRGVKMEFVRIPAGTFLMGSPQEEHGHAEDEPLHRVEITRDFYLGKYEVTQEQFAQLTGTKPSFFCAQGGGKEKVAGQDTSKFPVENVSWGDATGYCEQLNGTYRTQMPAVLQRDGYRFGLPTEAEWEYACRAGTTTPFHFGKVLNSEQANCDGTRPYGTRETSRYLERTERVGSYPANRWGLFDMHGNVLEWCQDFYDPNFYSVNSNRDPVNLKENADNHRVLRGGCWLYAGRDCRAAFRGKVRAVEGHLDFGFRVAFRPPDEGHTPVGDEGKTLGLDLGGGVRMDFVRIPKGKFLMGSPEGEKDRGSGEWQHEVEITRDFYLGKYEVMRGQFRRFVQDTEYRTVPEMDRFGGGGFDKGENKFKGPSFDAKTGRFLHGEFTRYSWRDCGYDQTDAHPAGNVTWADAQAFCKWLAQKTGKAVRLPTEAEWEYACRAGTQTAYFFGNDPAKLGEFAWFADNSGNRTHSVHDTQPNPWGLFGMHGNAWELCQDWYGQDYYAKSPQKDPRGPVNGVARVMRGGSLRMFSGSCRAAHREPTASLTRHDDVGFRVAFPSPDDGRTDSKGEKPRRPVVLDCTLPAGVSAAEVRRAQEAWAKYLGRPVEDTIELPGGVKLTFVLVPPGKFLMGSPKEEKDRQDGETLHEVTLTEPFDLGKTEVTQVQYKALGLGNPSLFKGDDRPVENVIWPEAQDWAEQLTKKRKDKYLYRLPTEAEWEYACRGGRPSAQPFGVGSGPALSSRQANFNGNFPYGGADKGPDLHTTCPVAAYPANALGLHDMHGNVWEWCQDWVGPYHRGAVANPSGPTRGSHRALRGGCWSDACWGCRAADRNQAEPGLRGPYFGFRVARAIH